MGRRLTAPSIGFPVTIMLKMLKMLETTPHIRTHTCTFKQDPEEFPGLAHFHEHMLFLGTEKYPKVRCSLKYSTFD